MKWIRKDEKKTKDLTYLNLAFVDVNGTAVAGLFLALPDGLAEYHHLLKDENLALLEFIIPRWGGVLILFLLRLILGRASGGTGRRRRRERLAHQEAPLQNQLALGR